MTDEAISQLWWVARLFGLGLLAFWAARRLRTRPRWMQAPFAGLGGIAWVFALTILVGFVRPLPSPATEVWFEGVRYARRIQRDPVRAVIHTVQLDLTTPGLEVVVTPPEPMAMANGTNWEVPARTTSQFLDAFDLQLAINANYYYPQYTTTILYYYPQPGDPVAIVGPAVSHGQPYGLPDRLYVPLAFYDGRAAVGRDPAPGARHVVSGYGLLFDGEYGPGVRPVKSRAPRTGAGVDVSGTQLIIVVIDGRQPFYSEGATLVELADAMRAAGAVDAINLDGGGSSTLVRRAADGDAEVVNLPVHGRIPPGFERAVGNHLGLRGLRPPPPAVTAAEAGRTRASAASVDPS